VAEEGPPAGSSLAVSLTLAGRAGALPWMFPLVVGRLLLVASSPAVGMETCLEVSSPMAARHVVEGPVAGLGLHPVVEASGQDLQQDQCLASLPGWFLELPAVV